MVSRRDIAGLVGGAAVLAMGSRIVSPAAAQTAGASETAFERVRRSKKLRIGAVAGVNPFYHKDISSGKWSGIYVSIAQELAKELEADLEILETTYGNAVLDLQSNKVDLFLGLNPTPKRALVIDFSQPLFQNGYCMITKKDFKPKSWAEMNDPNIKISVDIGSSQDQVVTRFCPKAAISRLKTQDEATVALQTGRADAQCITFFNALPIIKKNPSIGSLLLPTPLMRATSNIGFRRESDKTLREFVDTWISFNTGMGLIRDIVISNFGAIGISEQDFPPGVAI